MTNENNKGTTKKVSNKTIIIVFAITMVAMLISSCAVCIGILLPEWLPIYGIIYAPCQAWVIFVLVTLYDTPFKIIDEWLATKKFFSKTSFHKKKTKTI